jgi:hypothetical protein
VRLGIAEERHHAIAQKLGDVTAETGDSPGSCSMIASHSLAPFFRIEAGCNLSRTRQVTEENR